MAQTYLMYIELTTSQERHEIERFFMAQEAIYSNKKEFLIEVQGAGSSTSVMLKGLPGFGIRSIDDCITVSQLGFKLYDILKTAPSFQFAQVGYEIDNYFEPEGLLNEATYYKDFHGLVISNSIVERKSEYSEFEHFNDTHLWNSYKGENFVKSFKTNGEWKSELVWSYAEDYLKTEYKN